MHSFIHKQFLEQLDDKQKWMKNWNFTPYEEAYKQYIEVHASIIEKCHSMLKTWI